MYGEPPIREIFEQPLPSQIECLSMKLDGPDSVTQMDYRSGWRTTIAHKRCPQARYGTQQKIARTKRRFQQTHSMQWTVRPIFGQIQNRLDHF